MAVATTTGHTLEIHYDGEHRIDDRPIDYDAYPLYESPHAHAELHSGKMTFAQGNDRLELDFEIDPAAPLIPMRVIG